MPASARFCPKCGTPLAPNAPPNSGAATRLDAIRRAEAWLHLVGGTHAVPADRAAGPEPTSRSAILRGYAAALYTLARRYEHGRAHRNPAEAIRCFTKSARLGNAAAARRLAAEEIPMAKSRAGAAG